METTNSDDKPVLRLTWRQIIFLWTVGAAVIGIWWSLQRGQFQQARQLDAVSSEISILARTYERLEKRMEGDAMSRYNVADAARDQALTNARFTDHERRILLLEDRRPAKVK